MLVRGRDRNRIESRGFWIAQGSGANQGIYVSSREPSQWQRGAVVDVQGTYVEYFNLSELTDVRSPSCWRSGRRPRRCGHGGRDRRRR